MANETVTITAEMRDEVSGPVTRAAAAVSKANKSVESSSKRATTAAASGGAKVAAAQRKASSGASSMERATTRANRGVVKSWGGLGGKVRAAGSKVEEAARKSGEKSGEKMSKGLKDKFSKGLAGLAAAVSIGAVASGMNTLVNTFSQLQDATGAAGVVFGDNMSMITDQAAKAGETLGMTQAQVIDAANTFGTYGKAAGLSGKELAGFSTEMTTLAGDMASFKGTTPEQAIEAIGAALRGETEPIRAYGVMLDDASMRQEAMRMGIIKTTKDALTPQQKTLAAQSLILKQTTDAQGDFLRTQDSAANVQKRLQAATANLAAQVGGVLEPAFTRGRLALLGMVNGLSGFVTRLQGALTLMQSGATTGDIARKLGFGPTTTAVIAAGIGAVRAFFATLRAGETSMANVTSGGVAGFVERIAIAINRLRSMSINWGAIMGGGTLLLAVGLIQKLGGPLMLVGSLMGRLGPAIGLVSGALRFLLGPVGLIIGIFTLAYSSSAQFRDAINSLLPILMGLGAQLAGQLVPLFSQLVSALLPPLVMLFGQIGPVIGMVLAAVVPLIGQLAGAFVPILMQLITAVLPPVASLLGAVVPILGMLLGALLPIIPPVAQIIAVFLQLIMAVLRPIMPLITGLAGLLAGVLTGAMRAVLPVVEALLGGFSAFVGWVSSSLGPVIDNMIGWFRSLADVIGGAIRAVGDFMSNPLGGIQDALGLAGGGTIGLAGGGALHAAGGVLAGHNPGRDTVPTMLSRGESVLVPELTRAIGPANIKAANWAASHRRGGTGTASAGAGANPVAALTGGGGTVVVNVDARGSTGVDVAQLKATVKRAVREARAEEARRRYRG